MNVPTIDPAAMTSRSKCRHLVVGSDALCSPRQRSNYDYGNAWATIPTHFGTIQEVSLFVDPRY